MEFVDMTKNELEAYGRTVGIELDRRLTKAVLIDQLNEHIENAEVELSDELSDPVYLDAEIEEEDFPPMPEEMPAIKEEPVDPLVAIQAEKDARRGIQNYSEMLRQAEEKYQILKDKRVSAEVLELEALTEVEVARKNLASVQKAWEDSKELL
jgi:hypothetical protein